MQLPIVAILILALVVVNAIGYIACLLYLGEETARSDGMDAPCREEENIPFLHLVLCERITDGVVFHHGFILFGGDLLLKSAVELGILV